MTHNIMANENVVHVMNQNSLHISCFHESSTCPVLYAGSLHSIRRSQQHLYIHVTYMYSIYAPSNHVNGSLFSSSLQTASIDSYRHENSLNTLGNVTTISDKPMVQNHIASIRWKSQMHRNCRGMFYCISFYFMKIWDLLTACLATLQSLRIH